MVNCNKIRYGCEKITMNKNNGKVIPLPGLYQRYIQKGIDSLAQDHFDDSKKYFGEALDIDPFGSQAHHGFVLSLFSLGEIADAKAHCERMLSEGIGEYYDILETYMKTLIQLEEYGQVIEYIEAVLQERHVPPEKAESLYQMLDFCRRSLPSKRLEKGKDEKNTLYVPAETRGFDMQNETRQFLKDTVPWHALPLNDLKACKNYLIDRNNDPYFKSILLQILKEKHEVETISVYKFGKQLDVNLETMESVLEKEWLTEVKEGLSQTLEAENPSLYHLALKLWEHFVLTIFPFPILPEDPLVWAGAVYQMIHEMNGIIVSEDETAVLYHISKKELQAAMQMLGQVENREI